MSDMTDFNQQIINEFRANGGVVGGPFEGATVVLLTTTGARSGQPRLCPLVAQVADDGTVYVFASKAGAPTHPSWYHNLVANPTVTVEIGTDKFDASAEVLPRAERDAVYAEQVRRSPQFGEYEAATDRVIPVVALRRA